MTDRQFESLCKSVRFSLDEDVPGPPQDHTALSEYVSQVRSCGLRITKATSPELMRSVERTADTLTLTTPPEVYVVNDPHANACAPAFGPRQRPLLVIHSGLVHLLRASELDFVIGHELGHLGMRHPAPSAHLEGRSEFAALQSRLRQRYAEISADRIGLLATHSVYAAAQVMIKLASGLTSDLLAVDIDEFIGQLANDECGKWGLWQPHPALPIRLWALLRFGDSAEYARLVGVGRGTSSLRELDTEIADCLAQTGAGRLSQMEEEVFVIALTWLAVALVMEDGRVEANEREALVRLVGREYAKKALQFAAEHGQKGAGLKLAESLRQIGAASIAVQKRLIEAYYTFAHALRVDPEATTAWKRLEAVCGRALVQRDPRWHGHR